MPIRPSNTLALPLSLTLKSSETARNSTRVLNTWICSMQMAESTAAMKGISLNSVPNAGNQAAVRTIFLTAKATWDH